MSRGRVWRGGGGVCPLDGGVSPVGSVSGWRWETRGQADTVRCRPGCECPETLTREGCSFWRLGDASPTAPARPLPTRRGTAKQPGPALPRTGVSRRRPEAEVRAPEVPPRGCTGPRRGREHPESWRAPRPWARARVGWMGRLTVGTPTLRPTAQWAQPGELRKDGTRAGRTRHP